MFVVMGNDYPGGVYTTRELANKQIEDRKEQEKKNKGTTLGPRVHWRMYEFEVDGGLK